MRTLIPILSVNEPTDINSIWINTSTDPITLKVYNDNGWQNVLVNTSNEDINGLIPKYVRHTSNSTPPTYPGPLWSFDQSSTSGAYTWMAVFKVTKEFPDGVPYSKVPTLLTGNTGASGPTGKGFVIKGAWNISTSYVSNATTMDVVYYNEHSYVAKVSNINKQPDTSTNEWQILV